MGEYFYEQDADELYHFNFHAAEKNFIAAHFHRSMELAFVRSGNMKVVINGEERILREGEISVANSYDVHYYDGDRNSSVYVLLFGDYYKSDAMLVGKCFDNFLLDREKNAVLFSFLDHIASMPEGLNDLLKKGTVNTVLGIISSIYGLKEKREESKSFTEVLAYLEEHYREDISLEELSTRFGYTKNYFSTLFNRFTGTHLRTYLNDLRVEKVNKMVRNDKNITVTRAIFSCGFNSLNTYYRALNRKNCK